MTKTHISLGAGRRSSWASLSPPLYLLKNDISHVDRLSMGSLHVRSSSMFSIQLPAVNFLFLFLFLLTCHVWCQNFTCRYVRSSSMFSISAVVNFLFLFLFFLVLVTFGVRISHVDGLSFGSLHVHSSSMFSISIGGPVSQFSLS